MKRRLIILAIVAACVCAVGLRYELRAHSASEAGSLPELLEMAPANPLSLRTRMSPRSAKTHSCSGRRHWPSRRRWIATTLNLYAQPVSIINGISIASYLRQEAAPRPEGPWPSPRAASINTRLRNMPCVRERLRIKTAAPCTPYPQGRRGKAFRLRSSRPIVLPSPRAGICLRRQADSRPVRSMPGCRNVCRAWLLLRFFSRQKCQQSRQAGQLRGQAPLAFPIGSLAGLCSTARWRYGDSFRGRRMRQCGRRSESCHSTGVFSEYAAGGSRRPQGSFTDVACQCDRDGATSQSCEHNRDGRTGPPAHHHDAGYV